jgi:hypothetical protein
MTTALSIYHRYKGHHTYDRRIPMRDHYALVMWTLKLGGGSYRQGGRELLQT